MPRSTFAKAQRIVWNESGRACEVLLLGGAGVSSCWHEKEQFSAKERSPRTKKKCLNGSMRPPVCLRVPRARTGRPLSEPFPGSIVSECAKGVPELAPKGTKHARCFSLDVVSLANCVQQQFPGACWRLEVGGWMLDVLSRQNLRENERLSMGAIW